MTKEQIITVIIMAVIVLIMAIVAIILKICFTIKAKNKKIVLENSERIQALMKLNKTICFERLQSCYTNHQECNSKRQLDNFSLDDYLISLIDTNQDFYKSLINKLNKNISVYNAYINQVKVIKSTVTEDFCEQIQFKYDKFIKYENLLFRNKTLRKPQTEVIIRCKATYTSPAGRNHYWKNKDYNFNELKKYFAYTLKLKEQRQTRQYQIKVERAKMTDSLRYDILKRDNFRCKICGSSAQDGVKLHVDHIIPVAKGGKTISSNLRTLCDRCNMGKSDKI